MPYITTSLARILHKIAILRICEFRVVPDTDLAGYQAAGYPANNFAGYPAK